MDRIIRIFSKEYQNVNQAALLLGLFAFMSQILGLFRDRFIAHFIGPSTTLDTYYAAFRVPDLIFISIASLASVTVIIPFLSAKMKGDTVTKEAEKYLSDIFSTFFALIFSVSCLAFFLMPHLVFFIAPGFTPVLQEKVVEISRVMLLSPILMGLSNLFGTITQLFRKFFIYSLSPVLYNFGIIVGVLFLYPVFGIRGMAFGVVLGALMHFGIQALASKSCGFTPRFSFNIDFTDIKKVALISLPRTLGLAFNNIALICIISLASYLKEGSISIFNFSFNLQSVPLNIIGISYAVAAFPTLTKFINMGQIEEFRNHLKSSARSIIFWSLPATFLFIVLRAQITRVILGSPTFPWAITDMEKIASAAATSLVLSQEKVGEPKITRVIWARRTIKRKVAGRDQKIIDRAEDFK
jgi:putative peptidoglycan lipid II flippase